MGRIIPVKLDEYYPNRPVWRVDDNRYLWRLTIMITSIDLLHEIIAWCKSTYGSEVVTLYDNVSIRIHFYSYEHYILFKITWLV